MRLWRRGGKSVFLKFSDYWKVWNYLYIWTSFLYSWYYYNNIISILQTSSGVCIIWRKNFSSFRKNGQLYTNWINYLHDSKIYWGELSNIRIRKLHLKFACDWKANVYSQLQISHSLTLLQVYYTSSLMYYSLSRYVTLPQTFIIQIKSSESRHQSPHCSAEVSNYFRYFLGRQYCKITKQPNVLININSLFHPSKKKTTKRRFQTLTI